MKKEEYARPEYHPIDAAYQLTIELIQSGVFTQSSISPEAYADFICANFDTFKSHFEKLRDDFKNQNKG